MAVKLSDLTTESAPASTDILLIADPTTGLAKKITVSALKTYMDGLGGGGDTTAPVVVSATATSGSTVVIVFSESVTVTTQGWSFKLNGAAWAISSVSGSGATWTFTMATSAIATDTILRSYSSTTGNTVDTAANELVTFTDQAVTNSIPSNQLATPTLTATAASATQIDLSWTNVANESSYMLEWSANGTSGWTQIGGTIAANTTTYSHTGLTASTLYYYRVKAVGDGITYSDSSYGTDSETTASTTFLTWLSLGRNEQWNTSKGIRWDGVAGGTLEAYANQTLSAGQEVVMKVPDVAGDVWWVGLNENTSDAYTDWYYTVRLNTNYYEFEGGSSTDTTVAGVVGDWIKIKYAGTTLTIERSTNSGGSWTVIATDSRSASGSYNIGFWSQAGGPNEIYRQ